MFSRTIHNWSTKGPFDLKAYQRTLEEIDLDGRNALPPQAQKASPQTQTAFTPGKIFLWELDSIFFAISINLIIMCADIRDFVFDLTQRSRV